MFLIFVYKTYKMKTIKLSVLILSSILLFNSCGNGLSRSKAEKLLNESFKYPACEVTEFNFNFWTQNRDEFKNTLETGLLEEQMVYRFGSASDTKEFFISEKGKQYIIGDNLNYKGSQFNVITNSMVLYKITGIVEDKQNKTAVVQFVCTRLGITPFGLDLGYNSGDEINYSCQFVKYDDGWRTGVLSKYIKDKWKPDGWKWKQVQNNEIIKSNIYPFFNEKGEYIGLK